MFPINNRKSNALRVKKIIEQFLNVLEITVDIINTRHIYSCKFDIMLGELRELVMDKEAWRTLGESSGEAQSGRRLLGTNGGSLWLWCCLAQPGALGP